LHLNQIILKRKFEFCQIKLGRTTDKLAVNCQNSTQVGLQLKFAFRIRPVELYFSMNHFSKEKRIS